MFEAFEPLLGPLQITYKVLSVTAFVWSPLFFGYVAYHLWHHYRAEEYYDKTFKPKLLEIKLPRLIEKLPVAMEIVYEAMYQSSTGTWFDKLWKGRVLPEFSLEMTSTEGMVQFFIRTPEKFRLPITSALYAQYPTIEVVEAEDYVFKVPYKKASKEWSLWGCEYKLSKADAYPIKTYVDFKLDNTQTKDEQRSDPFASIVELLGSVGRGGHVWIQIMLQAATERHHVSHHNVLSATLETIGSLIGMVFGIIESLMGVSHGEGGHDGGGHGSPWDGIFKHQDWKGQGKDLIKKIQSKAGEKGLSKKDQEEIAAIQRSISKRGFDVGIRAIQVAKKDSFNGPLCGGIYQMFAPFASGDFNAIKGTRATDFDYPWEDFRDIRLNGKKWEIFDAYIRRSYFRPPYQHKPFVLNTEELATVFHLPGQIIAATPTLPRVDSRKSEPPQNLTI